MTFQEIEPYLHPGVNWLWVEESLKEQAQAIKEAAANILGITILISVKHLARPGEYIINQHHYKP